MSDREKVITYLDDMRLFADTIVHQIVSPENWGVYSDLCDFIDLVKEEIAILLKEQEAVEPYSMNVERTYGICPRCGKIIFRYGNVEENHYCGVCGKKVKWND